MMVFEKCRKWDVLGNIFFHANFTFGSEIRQDFAPKMPIFMSVKDAHLAWAEFHSEQLQLFNPMMQLQVIT